MKKLVFKIFGPTVTALFGDPSCYDRWAWLKKHIEKGPVRTMDAGCGSGSLSFLAAKAGNNVTGVSFNDENNKKATERAKIFGLRNARFVTENLKNLKSRKEEFGGLDQIICFETIEHLFDDQGLLDTFSVLLKPGGRLILTAPYKFYHHLPGDGITPIEDGGHVRWGYTHEELETMCAKAGLKIVKKEYISGFFSQALMRIMRIISEGVPNLGWALTFPLRPLVLLDPLAGKISKYPYLSVGIVAEKA